MTTQLTPPRIILDTDPGPDDIYAFLWLLSLVKSGLAELVAVIWFNAEVTQTVFDSRGEIFHSFR